MTDIELARSMSEEATKHMVNGDYRYVARTWYENGVRDALKATTLRAEVGPKWTATEDELQFARDIAGTPGFYTGAAVLVAKALLRIGMNRQYHKEK